MQHVAIEFSRQKIVFGVHAGAKCTGESEAFGNHLSDELWCRGDEPHFMPLSEVFFREVYRFGPEVRQNVTFVNDLGELDERVHRVPADNFEGTFPRASHVLVILAHGDEPKLVPSETGDVSPTYDSPTPRFFAQVKGARAPHQSVIHVKESHNRVMARWGRRYLVHSDYSKVVLTKRLTLIAKPGCHLCDDARETINAVIGELSTQCSVDFAEQSILDDEELHAKYWDEIPVVLINDAVHTIWRVEPARLTAALLEGTE